MKDILLSLFSISNRLLSLAGESMETDLRLRRTGRVFRLAIHALIHLLKPLGISSSWLSTFKDSAGQSTG